MKGYRCIHADKPRELSFDYASRHRYNQSQDLSKTRT